MTIDAARYSDVADLLTIDEFYEAAQRNVSTEAFDYASGGAGTENTMRRNREALQNLYFRPKLMRDVSERSTVTEFLGVPLSVPLLFAPVGSIAIFERGGASAVAGAAHTTGIASFVPTIARPSLEEVARDTDGPLFFQLYVRGNRGWLDSLVGRVEDAGYRGICVTVDHDVDARRERDIRNRFSRTALHGSSPNLSGASEQWHHAAVWGWSDFDWLRKRTALPLMLKGVTTAQDARQSVERGADAVYVSNHGGRALDHLPATIEVLEGIAQEVGGQAPLLVDGGIMHGSDIVKAIALGATAVAIGKLQCWALAAAGRPGLERVVGLLREEMSIAMGLLGITDVSGISRSTVSWAGAPAGL
jgi:isopentenyl diphosphate isomerase/L-lactate dehydrogenase-like FMN-dependent dehydrogenase